MHGQRGLSLRGSGGFVGGVLRRHTVAPRARACCTSADAGGAGGAAAGGAAGSTMEPGAIAEGWLFKLSPHLLSKNLTGHQNNFKKYWFMVDFVNNTLCYSTTPDDRTLCKPPMALEEILTVHEGFADKKHSCGLVKCEFQINTETKVFLFRAETEEERDLWVQFLKPRMQGYLLKRNLMKGKQEFQTRWFVLKNNSLYYFKSPKEVRPCKPCIPVDELVTETRDENGNSDLSVQATIDFFVSHGAKTFLLRAGNQQERDAWLRALREEPLPLGPRLKDIHSRKQSMSVEAEDSAAMMQQFSSSAQDVTLKLPPHQREAPSPRFSSRVGGKLGGAFGAAVGGAVHLAKDSASMAARAAKDSALIAKDGVDSVAGGTLRGSMSLVRDAKDVAGDMAKSAVGRKKTGGAEDVAAPVRKIQNPVAGDESFAAELQLQDDATTPPAGAAAASDAAASAGEAEQVPAAPAADAGAAAGAGAAAVHVAETRAETVAAPEAQRPAAPDSALPAGEAAVASAQTDSDDVEDDSLGEIVDSASSLSLSTEGGSLSGIARVKQAQIEAELLEIVFDELTLEKKIGRGSFGEVYKCNWRGTTIAVKVLNDQGLSEETMAEFLTEVNMMNKVRHPNVVLLMGISSKPPHLSIVTEYLARGSLYRLLHHTQQQLDYRRRLKMAIDISKGMNYLHSASPAIVHRDLKSPNLLVDENFTVKICDFGLARLKEQTFVQTVNGCAGTPNWMAPEVLRNEQFSEKADVFSMGVILWEIIMRQEPYKGMQPLQVIAAVVFQGKRLPPPPSTDPRLVALIDRCWTDDPTHRPSFIAIQEILQGLYTEAIAAARKKA